MPTIALSFLTGTALIQQWPALPNTIWLWVGVVAALTAMTFRFYRLALLLFGMLWATNFAAERLSDRLPPSLEGQNIQIHGIIDDLPEHSAKGVRFNLITDPGQIHMPQKIRLSWQQPESSIKAGQHWSFTVRLKRPHGHLNPGGFDYERWLFSENVGATGYVRTFPKPRWLGDQSPWYSPNTWRQAISDRLDKLIADPSGRAIVKALSIGDGNGINQQQWQLFRFTGTTHLMVISGSHVGLIAGLIYLAMRKLWSRIGILAWPPPSVAALTAMLVASLYSLLAGFSVPTRRSVVMLSVVMLAIMLQRHYRPWHTLSMALLTVLIFDPLAAMSAGFWLSFLAVTLIILASAGRLRPPHWLFSTLKTHWYVAAGLTPVLLLYFQQASLIAPIANLVAVPIVTFLAVPLSLLGVVLMGLWPESAQVIFKLDLIVLDALLRVLAVIADAPSATIDLQPSWWAMVVAVPALLLLLAPAGTPLRWLSLIMVLPLVTTESDRPDPGEMRLTLLDVGQGLAAIIRTQNRWLVYDAGARFSDNYDMGQNVVLPFLRARGAKRIDRLIVSHGDNDHIGGASSVMKGLPTATLLTSVPEALQAYRPVRCRAGQSWLWDEVKFEILSPTGDSQASDNNQSCVLRISSPEGSVLLPGDIENEAETTLVATYGSKLKSDVLIAPHHGSQSSSSQFFLEEVQPNLVLIPSGYRNPFGHPHVAVLTRYRRLGANWLISSESGAIDVKLAGTAPILSAYRQANKRYWHNR